MKRAWILAVALIFVSAAGLAQAPSPAPLSDEALAAILGSPAAGGACAPRPEGVQFAAVRPGSNVKSACTATAQCASGTISCSGNSTCSAQDRNCAIPTNGKVTCDGVTTWCPSVCTVCDQCAATDDCVACCQCQGLSYILCVRAC